MIFANSMTSNGNSFSFEMKTSMLLNDTSTIFLSRFKYKKNEALRGKREFVSVYK